MTTRLYSLVAITALCSGLPALGQSAGIAPEGRVLTMQQADTAAALLNMHVDSIDWVETTFEEVIDWLRDLSEDRVNVIPRWSALSTDSVGPEALITLKLKNVTVAEVLNEVLSQLSEDDTLGYHAIRNNLHISTKQHFDRKLYVRIYDVTNILFRIYDFGEEAPQIDLKQTARGGQGGSGGGQSVFSGGSGGSSSSQGGQQAEQEVEEQLNDMKALIEATIAPASWSTANTGGQGNIAIFNRSLVVYATIDVHEQIAGFFSYDQ